MAAATFGTIFDTTFDTTFDTDTFSVVWMSLFGPITSAVGAGEGGFFRSSSSAGPTTALHLNFLNLTLWMTFTGLIVIRPGGRKYRAHPIIIVLFATLWDSMIELYRELNYIVNYTVRELN
jgi:drug/metabolite transporter superfamily protein YnfA